MNKSIFIFLFFLTACTAGKWPTKKFIAKNNYKEVNYGLYSPEDKEKIDKYPMYPNGVTGVTNFIAKNTRYPQEAKVKGIYGKVIVKFIVEADGYIKVIEIVQSVEPILDNEAIRVIKLMDRWIPGYKNGKPVRVEFVQPFNFKLV